MTVTTSNSYLAGLLAGRPQLPASMSSSALAWLNRLRADAVDRVSALTVPTTHEEDWRFTDISPLTKMPFHPVRSASTLTAADIGAFVLPEAGARLGFFDGGYAPQLSFNETAVIVDNIGASLAQHGRALEPHLGRHAPFEVNVFAALNTAFLADGALVMVPGDATVAAPVHVLFIATQPDTVSYP